MSYIKICICKCQQLNLENHQNSSKWSKQSIMEEEDGEGRSVAVDPDTNVC